MSDGGYRDGRTGILQHLEEAERAVAERAARITPALVKVLPEELRGRIDDLRAVKPAVDDSIAELTRITGARSTLIEALDEAIAMGPSLAAELREVAEGAPPLPPQEDRWGPAGTEASIVPIVAEASRSVARLDPAAEVWSTGARISARLTVDGVPLLWTVELGAYINMSTGLEVEVSFMRSTHTLAVNVPARLPPLVVRPKRMVDGLLELLHLEDGIEVGDVAFDGAFFVEGDEGFARPLLTSHVCECLLERLGVGGFRVVLEHGRASVEWSSIRGSHVAPEPLVLAARVLVALRQSATSLELLAT